MIKKVKGIFIVLPSFFVLCKSIEFIIIQAPLNSKLTRDIIIIPIKINTSNNAAPLGPSDSGILLIPSKIRAVVRYENKIIEIDIIVNTYDAILIPLRFIKIPPLLSI